MHELSLAQNIIDIVGETTKSTNGQKVKYVRLKIGEMSNVLTDSLIFGFESLIEGTKLDGAKLLVEEIPTKFFCKKCRKETQLSELTINCSFCSSSDVEMISGNELTITELELE